VGSIDAKGSEGKTMRQQSQVPRRNYKQDFQRIVAELGNMLLIGVFKPRERLTGKNLSRIFDVSRFWIRDILKILEPRGLLK
jgi:DNA-binding GntR family transcriptional regulator